eukprot:5785269-Amphidinium_carterae.1
MTKVPQWLGWKLGLLSACSPDAREEKLITAQVLAFQGKYSEVGQAAGPDHESAFTDTGPEALVLRVVWLPWKKAVIGCPCCFGLVQDLEGLLVVSAHQPGCSAVWES